MADTAIAVTAGSGTNVDTRTEGTNGNHRQVIVLGDPATNAGVAPVDSSNGLSVTLTTAVPAGTNNIGDVDVASIAAGTNVVGKMRLVTATGDEITEDTDDSMQVTIVADDVGIGGGTQYATNSVAADPSTGTATIMERDDALSSLTPVEGDWVRMRGTAEGALWTQDFNSDALLSDTNDIAADTGTIASDTTSIDADTTTIAADTTSIDADTTTIASDTTSIDGKITACNTGAVVLTTGTASIGKLAANSGVDIGDVDILSIAAGDNNIGNVDIASALPAGTNAIGKLAANTGVDIGDVDVTSLANGAINGPAEPTIDSFTQVAINLDAGANQVLVSSAASKQVWVYSVAYTCSVAGTVSFQDEDDTAITGIMDHAANSGMGVGASGNFAMPIWKLDTDKDLEVDVTDAALDGWISYAIVSV
ncbi:MAG: hypothetical protein DRP09_10925 [Candidatus Thorarchaeota archaeon]|nr:MAG: hypothetical protein DRP09_10925 [Candidatus Thorarchaeota archaeon]